MHLPPLYSSAGSASCQAFGGIKLRSIETGLAAYWGVSAIQTFPVVQVQNPCPGFSVKEYSHMLKFTKGGNADQAGFAIVIGPSRGQHTGFGCLTLGLYYHKDVSIFTVP